MKIKKNPISESLQKVRLPLYFAILATILTIVALKAETKGLQRTFATPQEAVQATIEAAEKNDISALLDIFGQDGKDIVLSGDPAQDRELRKEFAEAARAKLHFDDDSFKPNRVTFAVGEQDWPFPVPLVRAGGKWRLDSASGRIEILARRIGRNQWNAIDVCRGYAEAQIEYASSVRDGDVVLKYAQQIVSTAGHNDGLYAEETGHRLVSRAFAEAAAANVFAPGQKPKPYHGYYFRMLKAQGPDAAKGAFDYVVNGKMIGGFALVAWPAEYGVSGVRTFIINHDGVVYKKDLGAATALQVRQMAKFNPDKTWKAVILE